eukprot:scaffold8637_cov30-Phaeocystis_antarctica.AAC.2
MVLEHLSEEGSRFPNDATMLFTFCDGLFARWPAQMAEASKTDDLYAQVRAVLGWGGKASKAAAAPPGGGANQAAPPPH